MRLIDADSLIKDLQKSRKYHAQNSRESELLRRCENIVCAQQTAYDVDRVVGQIESIMDDETIRFCDQAVKKSVDIVKEGGVNE